MVERLTLFCRLGIFIGFASFFFMEKTLRVLGSDDGNAGHSHSHSHSMDQPETRHATGVNISGAVDGNLRERNNMKPDTKSETWQGHAKVSNGPSKLSAYLNLFGDFVHNM